MGWIGWLVIAIVVLWLIGTFGSEKSSSKKKPKRNVSREAQKMRSLSQKKPKRNVSREVKKSISSSNKKPERSVSRESQEIAEKVTTMQQFQSLERKLERAEDRIVNAESARSSETNHHKYEVLQAAIDIAASQTYQWQFCPDLDLKTPKQILEHAYKVYSNEEYNEIKGKLSDRESEWHEIDGYGEAEDMEPDVKALIKFRSIIESSFSKEEKIKKINQLVSRNEILSEGYFDLDDPLKPGDQWFADELASTGLPNAYDFYKEGYTTPEKCLEIDLAEFSAQKGVGPKRVKELENYLAKVKGETSNV